MLSFKISTFESVNRTLEILENRDDSPGRMLDMGRSWSLKLCI